MSTFSTALQNKRPHYNFIRMEFLISTLYIDENLNLNFLRIDGDNLEETNAIIEFNKIHYYERAGNIHYTTKIEGNYSSFGGSITGGTFSKGAAALGGILFGPMGLACGALFSHKPTQISLPTNSIDITSEVTKIDDRNVILNYYSDKHKQYMDLELPAEIYNFLQTHIPEKKYAIVVEIEKQSAVEKSTKTIEISGIPQTPQADNNEPIKGKSGVSKQEQQFADFEIKVKKLKLMHDSGILTDKEFEKLKNELLNSL